MLSLTELGLRMRPRTVVIITLLAVSYLRVNGQGLSDRLPVAEPQAAGASQSAESSSLPDDPGQEMVPVAQPEPAPASGTPIEWEAEQQTWAGNIATLSGH